MSITVDIEQQNLIDTTIGDIQTIDVELFTIPMITVDLTQLNTYSITLSQITTTVTLAMANVLITENPNNPTFTWVDKVLTRIDYASNNSYKTFTYVDGDLTEVKFYNSDDVLIKTKTFTYNVDGLLESVVES